MSFAPRGNHIGMNEWSNISVIAPVGDIDISTVPGLRARVDGLVDGGARRILLNCQKVGFVDSTGMAFLLSRARRLLQLGGMLSLVNASAPVVRVLQIARLIDVLHVSAADRPAVPVLEPGANPLWSKTLQVRAGVENLGHYRHRVVDMLMGLALTPDERFDTALAAGEALSNAYDHAGCSCGCACLLTVHAFSDRVVIEVRDEGCGYEISDDEAPEVSEERGRGIRLMRMLVDSVEVRRRTDARGTLVRLIKLLDPEKASGQALG